ncbi:uncharacterized protein LOC120331691 [Styela clava]
MDIHSTYIVLVVSMISLMNFCSVKSDDAPTYFENVKNLSWKSAADRCQKINKNLCLRKDLCRQISKGNVPKQRINDFVKDTWVPILDEYNDWLYFGPKRIRQCDKLSETDGPPSWGEENCTKWNANIPHRKIKVFCQTTKGFFCCEKNEVVQKPVAHPVSIYVNSRKDRGIPYYSFSLERVRDKNDWFTDKASWRESGRLPGDLKKFTLMSNFVENKFEDPIFFCIRSITTKDNLLTTIHRISKRWCSYPWKNNFYLYGSYSVPSNASAERLIIGSNGYGLDLNSRVAIKDNKEFPKKHFLYVPSNEKSRPYIQTTQLAKDGCNGNVEMLSSESGIISSPGFPEKFTANAKKDVVCNWKISASRGSVIRITFRIIRLDNEKKRSIPTWKFQNFVGGRASSFNFDMNCLKDKVKISGYGTFCGNRLPPTFVTIDNDLNISFLGRRSSTGKSFSLHYEIIKPPNDLSMTRISDEKLQFFTWRSANDTCAINGKTLCKSKDICSLGSRPFYGVMQGDQWAPVLDEYNDWIQIGRGNVETCGRHNRIHGPPQWGTLEKNCHGSDMSRPCPTRKFLYCCNHPANFIAQSDKPITVLIYSTVQNGNIFFKYLRQGIDDETKFDTDGIWTPGRKKRGDITSLRLYPERAEGVDRVIYFCFKEIVPAIGKLKTAYSMFLQPCESKSWKLLYYLYASNKKEVRMTAVHVGISEKRPYHSRPHLRSFPETFQGDESFIIYSIGPTTQSQDKNLESNDEDSACSGNTSVIIAPSVLESPGYPTRYGNNVECKWLIRMPKSDQQKGNRLQITIEELSLEDPVDILTVYVVPSFADVGKALITGESFGLHSIRRDFTGMVSQVTMKSDVAFFLVFKSDDTVQDKGFRIKAEILNNKCGGLVTKDGDIISSPNHPLPYIGGTKCKWSLQAPSKKHTIELQFQHFDLISSKDCSDSVIIDGEGFKRISYCGGQTPRGVIILNENTANITFKTKSRTNSKPIKGGKGFAVKVNFVSTEKTIADDRSIRPQCGIQSVPFATADPATDRIVNGQKAQNGNFPWVVQIGKPRLNCGGSLINDQWVLTATHCFVAQFVRSLGIMLLHEELDKFVVIAGRYERTIPSPGEQHFNVTELMVHGGFTRYSARWRYQSGMSVLGIFPYNDIALLKLSKKAVFSPTVSPVCLPTQDAFVGDFCYVAGWGSRKADSMDLVSEINYAKVPILDNSLCNSWKEMKGTIMENALCAGYPEGGNDHCWGDSGGPLMCRGRYGNFYINGIVSWSRECGKKRMPGIYTRVWKYTEWIKRAMETV